MTVYQVVWVVLRLPGMVVLGLVFLRMRKPSLLLGIFLQLAAIALFALRGD